MLTKQFSACNKGVSRALSSTWQITGHFDDSHSRQSLTLVQTTKKISATR